MATFPPVKCFYKLSLTVAASFLLASAAVAHEFIVGGGARGWEKPGVDEFETYNHWASKNRFQIGDTLRFTYDENDSVLVVDKRHYRMCNASGPLRGFDDGDTTFRFERHGIFYFISGARGHCASGQRLMVRVMANRDDAGGPSSEQPSSGVDDASVPSSSAEPKSSAATAFKISTVGHLIMSSAVGSVLAIFLLFA